MRRVYPPRATKSLNKKSRNKSLAVRPRGTMHRARGTRRQDLRKLARPEDSFDVPSEITEDTKPIKTLAAARLGEMGRVKEELKAMLPTLTPSEVRRFRLPLHEAIIDELEERNYGESVSYLRELFELDEETRKETGPGTLTWEKPRLKDNRNGLLRLKEGLINIERAKNAGTGERKSKFFFLDVGDHVSTVAGFLNLALFFQAMTWEWWWIAERLHRSALENAKSVEDDDQEMSTLAHYLYGRFLFEKIQDTMESLNHLKVAREASQNKSWNASKIIGRKEETVFRECNVLLYKTLLMHAQQVDPDQPDVAAKMYTEALARATDCESGKKKKKKNSFLILSVVFASVAGHYEYMANALYELGMSQLRSGDVKYAFRNFSKFLALAKRISDPEGICNAHMAMAFAYKLRELGDDANTEKHLHLFMVNAVEFGLTTKVAQAHYCTGEHFLSKKRPDIATLHLKKSFELYNQLGLHNDADKVRDFAGVSKGELYAPSKR
ncbi:uncharacterized protein LOC105839066 [Monomorium pharaonis]|uniref:uncharacterized protein LOC105839066 n=1 Tax=Monomorium pharaonis TaxID=307658 RepID=UPI0017464C3F|nr:uncharacterized protein LOC105839066 [Monomorium pharaonis]